MPSDTASFIQVALCSPLRTVFDYLPEPGIDASDYPVGCRVLVPFGRREQIGLVVGHQTDNQLHPDAMKAIKQRLDETPLLPATLWRLGQWLCDYYHHPIGDTLFTLLPNWLRHQAELPSQQIRYWSALPIDDDTASSLTRKAPKQAAAWQYLKTQQGEINAADCRIAGHTTATLKALQAKQFAKETLRQRAADPGPGLLKPNGTSDSAKPLTTEQAAAFSAMTTKLNEFQSHLLFGDTGSGKTEVYLQLIERVIANGLQALVLIPEIGLTPQTIARFQRRFACTIAVFHSGLNDKQRLAAWLAVKNGEAAIAIGTRSAVFIPMQKPGIIIIDESHDSSYKQQEGLRYSARDTAIVRARYEQIPVVLGTATPSLESLHNANSGKFALHRLSHRANNASAPQSQFIDLRHAELEDGLSDSAIISIRQCIENQHQAMVFINRRGYAPCLLCQDCAWVGRCEQCDARLTYHQKRRRLICHHCDSQHSLPAQCPSCQSSRLNPKGAGTERTAQALQRLLPGTPILRIDRDTTTSREQLAEQLHTANSGKPCVLVGTQMLAKGHHFPQLNTVVVLDIDQGLYSPDFRAPERTLQLLTQVAGRAGRSGAHLGQVLIQTSLPEHPLLQHWQQSGYAKVANDLLQEREQYGLPPFLHGAMLRADSPKTGAGLRYLSEAKNLIDRSEQAKSYASLQAIGPMPATMERKAGRHRAQLWLLSPHRGELHNYLKHYLDIMHKQPPSRDIRCTIDVDPIDV